VTIFCTSRHLTGHDGPPVAAPGPKAARGLLRRASNGDDLNHVVRVKQSIRRPIDRRAGDRGQILDQAKTPRRVILVVEDDMDIRSLTAALFEDSDLEIVECESAEAALAVMLLRGAEAAMIFADIQLAGAMDGVDLAREAKLRWPHLTIVLTSGCDGERLQHLPPGVIYMPKPWKSRDVLIEVDRARASAQGRTMFGR
jgi:CheY-like chemotaxis protein